MNTAKQSVDPAAWNGEFNGDAQPLTLGEWLERKRREFVLLRASVHAQLDTRLSREDEDVLLRASVHSKLDELLNKEEARMEQAVQDMVRDLRVEYQHDPQQH